MNLLVPPPVVGIICAALIWAASYVALGPSFRFLGQVYAAYALIGLGLVFDGVSVAAFFKEKTTVSPLSPEKSSALVKTGLYRFTRNPMYLGLLLILAGFAALKGTYVGLAVLPLFVGYITAFQIKPEEERLAATFGEAYQAYQRRVRRWI